jgi:hypothetical protein
MGKASRTKSDPNRRERIAAQRAAERRREQRRRLFVASGSILAVVVIVVAFVVWKTSSGGGSSTANTANGPTGAALTSVTKNVTDVPASALDQVGAGGASLSGGIKSFSGGAALTSDGKPEVFFYGAEYCPFCAANRWGLVVALSRFGTFSGLKTISSSATDQPASVPTFTFHGSSYTSKYISFASVETLGNVADSSGSYPTLETPTAAEQALVTKYDAAPYVAASNAGSIPFVDFGNKYLQAGDLSMLSPSNLTGNWQTIASDLSKPSTGNAKAVDGAANFMTAAICKLTNNQPASACTSTVQALESQL